MKLNYNVTRDERKRMPAIISEITGEAETMTGGHCAGSAAGGIFPCGTGCEDCINNSKKPLLFQYGI